MPLEFFSKIIIATKPLKSRLNLGRELPLALRIILKCNNVLSLINESHSKNAQYKMANPAVKTHSSMWDFDQCEQTFRLDFHNALFV